MPEDTPDRMLEDMPDRMPEGMPDRMPDNMSDRMPEDMPDKVPECLPDRMPDRMPEDMSDRMPEDLPVTKCINVMVGITRSNWKNFAPLEVKMMKNDETNDRKMKKTRGKLQIFHFLQSFCSTGSKNDEK